MSHNITISQEVLDVLSQCTTDGNNLYLPPQQLDRQLYVSVNKILEILGGTWKRKAKAHVFDHDPSGDLAAAIESGKVEDWKKKYQFYETPEDLAERMVRLAELKEGQRILEPSAGKGAIARVIRDRMPDECVLDVIEIYGPHQEYLVVDQRFFLVTSDFLEFNDCPMYDHIIMNPPFTGLQDVDHILHAYECLAPGGRIVGIMGESAFFVDYKKAVKFREWFDEVGGWSEQLPQDTFKESGAGGKSRLVIIRR
jgi:hypothetical protein